ncbi:hypothetical protein [Streptomyces anulatus]|uniref:hypothetical protein n=1 Tax=Streptomyces anulatus TaxID=1892 RepID=UPI0035E27213
MFKWRDLPGWYGPWKTAHERHRRRSADGTWEQPLQRIQAKEDAVGDIDWAISVDSTTVRAHHRTAGARNAPPPLKRVSAQAVRTARIWADLIDLLAEVVREVKRSAARVAASPSSFT